jgi:hypothetical protein
MSRYPAIVSIRPSVVIVMIVFFPVQAQGCRADEHWVALRLKRKLCQGATHLDGPTPPAARRPSQLRIGPLERNNVILNAMLAQPQLLW